MGEQVLIKHAVRADFLGRLQLELELTLGQAKHVGSMRELKTEGNGLGNRAVVISCEGTAACFYFVWVLVIDFRKDVVRA